MVGGGGEHGLFTGGGVVAAKTHAKLQTRPETFKAEDFGRDPGFDPPSAGGEDGRGAECSRVDWLASRKLEVQAFAIRRDVKFGIFLAPGDLKEHFKHVPQLPHPLVVPGGSSEHMLIGKVRLDKELGRSPSQLYVAGTKQRLEAWSPRLGQMKCDELMGGGTEWRQHGLGWIGRIHWGCERLHGRAGPGKLSALVAEA
jgi:hypothetical protein